MQPEPSAIGTLGWIARGRAAAAKTYHNAALDWLTAQHLPTKVDHIAKAAVGASTTTDSTLGTEGISIGEWSNSARTSSAFYRILNDGGFIRMPMNVRVAMVTSAPTAGVVAEGKAIPVSKATLSNVQLVPQRAGGLVVVSDELLFRVDAAGQQMLNRELLNVVSVAVDAAFVDKIDTGLTPIVSSGPLDDVRAALLAVSGSLVPRPYWLAAANVAKLGATATTAKGGPSFAAIASTGGELANIPLLVSSAIPNGMLYLIDAAQIAADAASPIVDISSQADIQMDSAPTMASDVPTGTTAVSMFQTNSTALKATAVFAVEKLRASAVAVVSGITGTTWATT